MQRKAVLDLFVKCLWTTPALKVCHFVKHLHMLSRKSPEMPSYVHVISSARHFSATCSGRQGGCGVILLDNSERIASSCPGWLCNSELFEWSSESPLLFSIQPVVQHKNVFFNNNHQKKTEDRNKSLCCILLSSQLDFSSFHTEKTWFNQLESKTWLPEQFYVYQTVIASALVFVLASLKLQASGVLQLRLLPEKHMSWLLNTFLYEWPPFPLSSLYTYSFTH